MPDILSKLEAFVYDDLGGGRYSIRKIKDKFAQSVEIPEGVVEIGVLAFSGCALLRSVTLPTSLLVLERSAFERCVALEEVVFLGECCTIGESAFCGCSELKKVVLPKGLAAIPNGLFSDASSLKDLVLPESVKKIGNFAFQNSGITTVKLPISIEFLDSQAFDGVKRVHYMGSREQWKKINKVGTAYQKAEWRDFKITFEVTASKAGASSETNPQTSEKTLAEKLKPFQYNKIGERKYSIFRLKDKFAERVEIPEGVFEIQANAFAHCPMLRSVTLPNTLVVIRQFAFRSCTALEEIVIPDSVTILEGFVFQRCYSLKRAILPRNLKNLEDQVFCEANALSTIEIPETVERIGGWAFAETAMKRITVPASVKHIGQGAFSGIQEISYLGTREQWKELNQVYCCDSTAKVTCIDDKKPEPPPATTPRPSVAPANVSSTTSQTANQTKSKNGGCYVATCVYGSYDCPEVWTLRRYRDDTLGATWYGRLFIRFYYATSPTLVKWFGKTRWFKHLWRGKLDKMVARLQENGVENTPYNDKRW